MMFGNRRNIGYKYFTWNCDRGLLTKNKLEDIKCFAVDHKPDFMGISEIDLYRDENNFREQSTNTFSTQQVHEKFRIEGYKIYLPACWETHDKARIMVYANEEIKSKFRQPYQNENHLQSVLLEVGYGRSKTHLVNFYYREWKNCATGQSDKASQIANLSLLVDIWRRCIAEDRDFISLGDINLCAKQWDKPGYVHSNLAEIVKDFMVEENCCQIVNQYTRIRQVGDTVQRSCLDHIIINCLEKISSLQVHGVGSSDHLGISVMKSSREIRTSVRTTRRRVYKSFDKAAFIEDIKFAKEHGDFSEILRTDDIELAGDIFTQIFNRILDHHAPVKVIQNRKNYVPYISEDIHKAMEERNELKKEAAKTGDNDTFNKYKKKRNDVSRLLKSAESKHYTEKFSNHEVDSKETWKASFEILGKSRSDFPSQMMFGSRLVSKPIEIANELNKFFVQKIQALKTRNVPVIDSLKELVSYLSTKHIPEGGFSLKEINEETTRKLIKKMKNKKSCGLDWICGISLKLAAPFLIPEITALVNITIRNGSFYSKWKRSKVLPGFKNKGSKFDAKFYRPISNLSEISKLAEKVVHEQTYHYLVSHGLLHPDHHGFLKNHSTATALQQLVDTWLQAADCGKLSATLMLDLRAGFDVINHEILFEKLRKYGFSNNTLNWFRSYLLDRYQCVQIESSLSDFLLIPWGVPQGSILGPLLFIIYINELPEVVKKSTDPEEEPTEEYPSIVVYADDNSPTTSHADADTLLENIENDGRKVTGWFDRNDMFCSGEKTKLMITGTRSKRLFRIVNAGLVPKVTVCEDEVHESQSEKLLGVIANNTLTWKNHLYGNEEEDGLIKNLSRRVNMLSRLRKFLPDHKFKSVVAGLFTSKLSYCMTVWGPVWNIPGELNESEVKTSMSKEDIRKLQVLHNKCLRLQTRQDRSTPTTTLLNLTKSLSVHQMIAHKTVVQVYNVHQNQAPKYHYDRLFTRGAILDPDETRITNLNTRVEFSKTAGRGSFFYQGSRLWSALPLGIKMSSNPGTFKNLSKNWIKSNINVKP